MPHKQAKWTGNIGEWSEPYVIYKLLADGRLCQATKDFLPSQQDFVNIVSIIREDVTAERAKGAVTFHSVLDDGTQIRNVVAVSDMAAKAAKICSLIKGVKTKDGSFPLPWFKDELITHGFKSIKDLRQGATHISKRDVTLKVDDPKTGGTPVLGFSVKSEMGAPPTLLNASKATNIIYRIKGLTADDAAFINEFDGANKIIWKCEQIKKRALSIEFEKYNSQNFAVNLDVVDAVLPRMMADLLKVHYFETLLLPRKKIKGAFRPNDHLKHALQMLTHNKPYCDHPRQNYCEIKVKRFLRACALGMMPDKVWNDVDDANGGYIIILPNGELIGFYVYNRQLFEDYLLSSTMFERGSTSRHGYLKLEPDGGTGDYFLKLNLCVRFIR